MSLKNLQTMKRKSISPLPPSTPPTPQNLTHFNTHITPSKPPLKPLSFNPNWTPLSLTKTDLNLPLTFPTGQTFRWKQTAPLQFTGVISGTHIVSLKQSQDNNIYYHVHDNVACVQFVEKSLLDFLNVDISLAEMWEGFKGSDERFGELAECFPGVRVLRQDPLECLIQFICSSNNNIGRITKMVDYVSGLGRKLGCVGGFEFYGFPSLDRLGMVSEEELRDSGFGYRAKYIIGTVKALQSKPGGGVEWLSALRMSSLEDAVDALCTLPGVGPKVAACVALFSLDQHHAIPVDTHVWQIATRHLMPELAGTSLTPKLHNRVANAFVSKYGKYAGWAQTLLFIADLPSQKAILPSLSKTNAIAPLIAEKEGKKKKVKRTLLKEM